MRISILILISFLFISFTEIFAQTQSYPRSFTLKARATGGYGNVVAGVDLDNDGKPEIYACNNNLIDRPEEMVPRIWKFELNGNKWDSVWGAVMNEVPKQNTWPALAVGDLDGDGRKEIIWGPVNFLDAAVNPNPARIVVYEYRADGSNNMGVSDGFGGWLPNAKTSIITVPNTELRPCMFFVDDVDADGKQEIVYNDRRASSANYHYGVISVNNIPNDGNGSEVWTIEANGKDATSLVGTGNKWDLAYLNNVIYLFNSDGKIFPIKRSGSTWTVLPAQNNMGGSSASFRASIVVDVNKDNTKEIVVAQWLNLTGVTDTASIFLLKQQGDTLVPYKIASFRTDGFGGFRLNGAGFGDIDGDSKTDMVFGTRYDVNQKPNNAVYRLEYQGGDITSPNSYTKSTIDSLYYATGSDIDILSVANVDYDASSEVIYSSAYTRGNSDDSVMAIVVLDNKFTPSDVKADYSNIPQKFFMDQNFPNPFNPSTAIKFGLSEEAAVDLVVYNLIGEKVLTVIDNEIMQAGTYTFNFKAVGLSSGTYIYKLKAGEFTTTRKMQLLK